MQFPSTFEVLIEEVNQLNLYKKLVAQLNKDFLLANINLDFHEDILPSSLKLMLHETVYRLIQDKFTDYLSLLYIIDVPEHEVRQLNGDDMVELAECVTFIILKREWQKVWYRHKF
jgi:FKBP-type peptidyl-prolyl cis-trans isomerase (trigger factor)